ncbi:MAG: hypothetical protein LBH95_05800 [Oscillospiraceae bacterium]|jgi:peptidoglycan/LPS O-acetylase OafA/YrhL|nr:hypothetical protein [Oscillospiraceae bacterium]
MRNKNGVAAIGIIGLLIVIFSLAAFFLLEIERIAINGLALACLLLSECVLFGGLIALRFAGARHNNVFLKAGVTTSLSLYLVATIISLFFAGMLKEKIYVFILIELAIIILFGSITISIFAWSRGTARRDAEDMAKVGTNEPKRGGF